MFAVVYLITLGKYKFWLLPNLNKDVGILGTFWPLYESNGSNGSSGSSTGSGQLSNSNQLGNPNNTERSPIADNQESSSNNGQSSGDSFDNADGTPDSEESQQVPVKTGPNQQISQSITEFEGNDHLPTITTTPPPPTGSSIELANSRALFGRPTDLEIIDLNASEERPKHAETGVQTSMQTSTETSPQVETPENSVEQSRVDGESKEAREFSRLDDYANITPVISYLNVNELKRRKRMPSNRSDDGFEILNDDFLNSPPIIVHQKQSTPLFLAKQSLL